MEPAERKDFTSVIASVIARNTSDEVLDWIKEKVALVHEEKESTQLNLAFAAIARKTGRRTIQITANEQILLEKVHKGFFINDWTIDRLARLWLLMHINSSDQNIYLNKIQNLFTAAEMNELAALYSSLFFFDFPQEWQERCAEGIRSNIGIVLEAIMYNNPYPYHYLNDLGWNQLVLKAFFTDKNVNRIIGLDERANKELAWILIDYANERWAAHRTVNPQLWRLVSKFLDETNFKNIEKAFKSSNLTEKKAAALACFHSNYPLAKNLLESEPDLKSDIIENKLNWNTL